MRTLSIFFTAILLFACGDKQSTGKHKELHKTLKEAVKVKKNHVIIQSEVPAGVSQKGLRALTQAYFVYYESIALIREAYRLNNLEAENFADEIDRSQRLLDTLKSLRYTDPVLQTKSNQLLAIAQERIRFINQCANENHNTSDEEMKDSLLGVSSASLFRYCFQTYGPPSTAVMALLKDDSLFYHHPQRQKIVQTLGFSKNSAVDEYHRLSKIISSCKDQYVVMYATLLTGDLLEFHDNELRVEDVLASEKMYNSGLHVPFYHPFYFELWKSWSEVYQLNWGGQSSTSKSCALIRDRVRQQLTLKIISYLEKHPNDIYAQAQFYNILFYNPETGLWPYHKVDNPI